MQTCNLKSMKQSKIKNLLIVIFLIFSVLIPTINLSAREVEQKRGYNGTISKEKILSTFIKDECVVGHVIKGDDIIEIIKATDHEIWISDSIIEGGLNFTKLPAESWEKVELPKDWNTQAKEAFIKRKRKFHPANARVVKNRITIINSEIRPKCIDGFSVKARGTFFYKKNVFKNVTFSDKADFSWAIFSDKADFSEATFSGKAGFSEAIFSGKAYFSGATFSNMAYFSGATFSNMAYFSGATFSNMADFSWATFSKLAYFEGTEFNGVLDLELSEFKEYLDFRNAKIRRLDFNSHISPTILRGRVDFRKSIISEAHFQDIIFENDVDFSDVQFGIPIGTENDKRLAVIFRFITFCRWS